MSMLPSSEIAETLGVEFLCRLGAGASGTVYKARQLQDDQASRGGWRSGLVAQLTPSSLQLVAVKAVAISSETALHQVNKEIMNQQAVSGHKYIVEFYSSYYEEAAGIMWITMELCEGGDLADFFDRQIEMQGYIPEHQIWMYFYQLVDALRHCHELREYKSAHDLRHIVHADIKPPNILVSKDDNKVKLADFGLSEALNEGRFARRPVGTLDYMSPELVAKNPSNVRFNAATDIWSLGCVMKELCNLAPTFDDADDERLKQKIRAGKTTPISTFYSPELASVIESMLRVNFWDRPSASDLLFHPGMKLGEAATELAEKQAYIRSMEQELEQLNIQLAQMVIDQEAYHSVTLAFQEKENELSTVRRQLKIATSVEKARVADLDNREEAVRQCEEANDRAHEAMMVKERELQERQELLIREQALFKEEQSRQQKSLDERAAELDGREQQILAREQSLKYNSSAQVGSISDSDIGKHMTVASTAIKAIPAVANTASARTAPKKTSGETWIPKRMNAKVPEMRGIPLSRKGTQTARAAELAPATCASSSVAPRIPQPLPQSIPVQQPLWNRPTAASIARQNPTRSNIADAAREGKRTARTRSDERIPNSHIVPPTASITRSAANQVIDRTQNSQTVVSCGSPNASQRKIRSAVEIRTHNRAPIRVNAAPAAKWSAEDVRKQAGYPVNVTKTLLKSGTVTGDQIKTPAIAVTTQPTDTERTALPSTLRRYKRFAPRVIVTCV